MKDEERIVKILEWALSDDTGSSSKEICRFMCDLPLSIWKSAPYDASDRGRCIRLLDLFPSWWDKLDQMKFISKEWAEQIPLIKLEANP